MKLTSLDKIEHHPTGEALLKVLRAKTQNIESDCYFRVLSVYYLAQMAASMRVSVNTPHRGVIPVNVFACCLATSGAGKGHSVNIMERQIVKGFKTEFTQHTFPAIAQKNLETLALKKSNISATDFEDELEIINKEFNSYGAMPYSFDSGTGPAFKQVRTKAQMANIGALNMISDEIGTNLLANSELFAVNLEACDMGLIKQKIIKNTSDNKRAEERDDPVPSNMLIFGTPSKLFNGGKEENEFYSLLDTGYARRLLFGIGNKTVNYNLTAQEVFDQLTSISTDAAVSSLNSKFANLADPINYNKQILMEKDVSMINIQYQLDCEKKADELSEFDSIKKAELQHRYFKAIKVAGTLAFSDSCFIMKEMHMNAAIKLIEESGEAFNTILTRDKNYIRLAKYIAAVKKEVTHADLVEDLGFYTGSASVKTDMLNLAIAWGYKNNIIIKKSYLDSIEFFRGESLVETKLSEITISYSQLLAHEYTNTTIAFDKLHKLTQVEGYHWVNHHVINGHRCEEDIQQGFNLLVIDCDGEVSLATVKLMLSSQMAFYYTTKRHTPEKNRFRIVMPMSYSLKLSATDYKQFMKNVYEWLPFSSDENTGQRSKKWLANKGHYEYVEGDLFDPLPYIPKTTMNSDRIAINKSLKNMGSMERFFAKKWNEGSRNDTLIKYGLMLLDSGMDVIDVQTSVMDFNTKFGEESLPESEIMQTVIKTIFKKATN